MRPVDHAAAVALVHTTEEPDEHASAIAGGAFEFLRVPGVPFRASLRRLLVADMVLQQGESAGHAMSGAMHAGLSTLLLPFHFPQGAGRLNGAEVRTAEALLLPGGAEFRGACASSHQWVALAVSQERMAQWLDLPDRPVASAASPAVLQIPQAAHAELLRICIATLGLVAQPPEALLDPASAESLARSLADTLIDAVSAGAHQLPAPRAAREAQRVVRLTEEYLRAHIDRPIHREEICDALGVSLRKLHDAFMGVTGVSPQVYLKMRRLALVRRALRSAAGRPALVKSIALSHGFWHLGHFARDYRLLFGEPPSATAARVS